MFWNVPVYFTMYYEFSFFITHPLGTFISILMIELTLGQEGVCSHRANGEVLDYGQGDSHVQQPTSPKYHAERSTTNVEGVPGNTELGSEQPRRDLDTNEIYADR